MSSTEDTMYKKRARTTGMSGQLYETKLVGFALFKLLHDEQIEYFYLASNLDEIGCFDDLCFKAKIRGIDRPFIVFIQAKHKDDDNAYVDFDEAEHFHDSYSKVVQKFYLSANDKKNKDKIFIGNFEDYECIFILYTNGKYKNDSGIEYESAYASVLNDLISTDRKGTKLHCTDQIVEDLVEAVLKVEIEGLAEHFAKFLSASQSMQMMLDDIVKRYHVVLTLNAVDVSKIYSDENKPDTKWRIMTFREDFFTSNDKNLTTLRKAMFKKILQNHAISKNKKPVKDAKVEEQLQSFFKEPCLNTLSPLIGTHILYKEKKFEFASQRTESEKEMLKQIKLSQDIINEAEAIVARNILLSPELKELKVSVTFGNTDLMISERRITHLVKNIVDLSKKFKLKNGHKIVTLDETVDAGILNINGGLGGTVGNLLVYEESTKLLKFVDNSESLQNNARLLYDKLQSDLADLHVYRFYVKPMLPFPVLSFDCDSGIAREISKKLVIYAGQSDQKRLETKLKKLIEDYQKVKYPNMQVQAESLFQNYHSNIQTWSLLKTKAPYLTKDSKIYQEALNNIFFEPQMSSLRNTFHMTKMKHIEYSTESLKTLQRLARQKDDEEELKLPEIAVIVTDVAILTAIKVIQYLRSNGVNSYSILDLECLLNLPTEDFCSLKLELKNTEKVLLVMCHNLQSGMIWYEKYLKEIAQTVGGKRKIVITNSIFLDMVQNIFSASDKKNAKKELDDNNFIIINEKHSLVDLTQESQEDIMKNSNIIFQGQVTSLDVLLDESSVPFIEGVILNKIVFNETIEIGKLHSDANYDEISHLYQDRTVEYINCHPISGRLCISSTVCVTDDSQASCSNNLASNQQRDQLVGSIFSVTNTDSGVSEEPFSMYFSFDIRIYSEKGTVSQDTDVLIVALNGELVSGFRVKIKNFINKVWNVKITLFDDSMRLRNWLKDDSVLEDTLKALRYLCQGAVLNNIVLNEDIVVIPADNFLDSEEDLQCFWYKSEGFENNKIIDGKGKDCDNNVTTDEDSSHNTTLEVVQKNNDNNISTTNVQRDSSREESTNLNVDYAQSDFDNKATEGDKLKESATNVKDHIQIAFDNNVTIDEKHKDSINNATVCAQRDSGNNIKDRVQIDSDNNVTIDEEQKYSDNNATVDSAEKHSDSIVISDDAQKDFIKSFRMYFERSFYRSVPVISFIANNLQDETIKHKQENVYKDDKVSGGNVRLDESLLICEENARNFQITFRSKHRIELKTFDDLKDDVILLTAKAGLGKSTILTHLSRKINKLNKHVWVVRINLLNYSREFKKWQRYRNIRINNLTTLNLMVQAVFKNITVDLKEDSSKIIFENCSGDEWIRFNLKMFLNYYNNGKLLFIFDGFDEICPDYKNEVLLFLNIVKNYPCKNKMWITSRPYNAILPDLEQSFGKSFRLEYLNKTEQTEYLRRYWDKSINIKDYTIDLLESLLTILSMVIVVVDIKLKIICYDFYKYIVAKFPAEHSDEIKVRMEVIEKVHESVSSDMNSEENEFMGTPLLLHLIAGYFVTKVLDFRNLAKVGRVNIITMYEWFIETKLIRILFKDKYGMNIDIPFVKERCEAELKQSLSMYKKLGAQAIFGNPIFTRNGLNLEEFNDLAPFNLSKESGIAEFEDAVNRIRTGKDKTGLISYVTDNGTPVFIHKTFAEYFAVEFISDILKNETVPYETKKLIITVMLSIMLKESVVDDHGKLVSRGSLGNWVREKCIVDEDYNKIGEEIIEREPFINKYNSVVNTISNDMWRRAYIRLINSTADDYNDPSFKECHIEEYLSGKRKFDDDLFLMMKPHFRRKFPEFSKSV